MNKSTSNKDESPQSNVFRIAFLTFVLLLVVTLLNGAYGIVVNKRITSSMVATALEERLAVVASVIRYELRELDFVGGIVREQEQKIIYYLDFDKLRPIQVMLQTIASKHSLDEVFFLDEDRQLLVTNNRIVDEGVTSEPYAKLVDSMPGKASFERFPASFFQHVSHLKESVDGLPAMLTVMKRVVPIYHDMGDTYGYVVMVRFVDGNQSIAERLAESTGFPFVIYNDTHQTILSNLSLAAVPYPQDGLMSFGGTSYVGKLHPLNDFSGSLLAELGIFMDQTILVRQSRRQVFNNLLPLAVIACIALFLHFLMGKLRKSYQQLERSRQEAESANIAKSEFLANMSHEIRTPLNAIVGLGGLVLKTNLTEKQCDYMMKIKSSSSVLLGIINNILDFSKIEAGMLELESAVFRCDDVLNNVKNIAMAAAEEKGVGLLFHTNSNVPQLLKGDSMRIFQVLLNLTTNAIKFTNTGQVDISVTTVPSEVKNDKNLFLCFAVEDSGIGLSKEQMKNLFDPFTQADSSTTRKFGGTGLGLTICKEMVEIMGGAISVVSEPDSGSNFSFTVQVATVTESEVLPFQHSGSERRLDDVRGASILLVEDNEINQQVAAEYLRSEEFIVTVVDNGQKAVDAVISPELHAGFDLVLMDVQMPVMDGYTATREIRNSASPYKDLPIIAMTAHALSSQRQQCLDAGMNDHVTKPFDPDVLFAVLVKWITPGQRVVEDAASETNNEEAQIVLPSVLPGLDLHNGLKRVAGNATLYLNLLSSFRRRFVGCERDILHALQESRIEKAQELLHRLKGGAGNVGALELHKAAGALEFAADEKDTQKRDTLCQDFSKELLVVSQSIKILENLSIDTATEPADSKVTDALDKSNMKDCCENLRQLITDDYGAAIDAVIALREMLGGTGFSEEVDRLERLLEEFKEQDALLCLNEIEKKVLEL